MISWNQLIEKNKSGNYTSFAAREIGILGAGV